ncbi:hypothetical protein KP509_27G021100 [Ceratopteris richardii]|nr:hypothetical protein KP509_27G021100 [Ceratopteris richardii]
MLDLSSLVLSHAILINGFSSLSALRTLNLSNNSFFGTVANDIVSCPRLAVLDLSYNSISALPASFSSLSTLEFLNLTSNNISSPLGLPVSLCSRNSLLHYLDISDNALTGGFPTSIINCTSLRHLDVSDNKIIGPLPSEIGGLRNMQVLKFSGNGFSGSVPAELGNLSALHILMGGSNDFTGSLPSGLSQCQNLTLLDFDDNHLSGSLPDFLHQAPSLRHAVLHSNAFTGPISSSLFNASGLIFLDISNNTISGSISPQISRLSSLRFLLMANNKLSGKIPTELYHLSNLIFLDLSSNMLDGFIPASLGRLTNLLWLMLAHNNLTGKVPPELGNCSSLLWLNLRSNALTGALPKELASMGQDPNWDFISDAKIMDLPKMMGECLMLKRLVPENFPPYSFIYDNLEKSRCEMFWLKFLTGIAEESFRCGGIKESGGYIQVSDNTLSGRIPSKLQAGRITILFLSGNLFSGPIPDGFGDLPLRHLNVSRNRLSGAVPSSLSKNPCLMLLDLSYNNLSGLLPSSLTNLFQLSSFNVSYNPLLTGRILISAQFSTFDNTSYFGDPLLCFEGTPGMPITQSLPLCRNSILNMENGAQSRKAAPTIIALWAILAIFNASVALCLIGIFCRIIVRRKAVSCKRWRSHLLGYSGKNVLVTEAGSSSEERSSAVHVFGDMFNQLLSTCSSAQKLTYADILLATSNFDEENILGCGGFGIVYKATLVDGTILAVKKLMHYSEQGEREFLAEMETLGSLNQENLVPLLGCFAFGEEKLLVYKYFSNGSLEYWLHDKEGSAQELTWRRRLRVAADCARALSYLHHECTPVLIHRDIKTSNVLLDEEFHGFLADFGLARGIGDGRSHVSTVVAGTFGYVAPEYSQTWRATPKGDVYSFGVVLLELLTGRHPTGLPSMCADAMASHERLHLYGDGGNLVDWTRALVRSGCIEEAFHPSVKESAVGRSHELLRFMEIAQACTAELPEQRPSMSIVSSNLQDLLHPEDRIHGGLLAKNP